MGFGKVLGRRDGFRVWRIAVGAPFLSQLLRGFSTS